MEHEPSLEEKISVASNFILQSPPGEVNDVFNDVRPIVGDDAELENGLLPALSQYNTEQLTLVELPNAKIPAMICEAAKLNEEGIENLYMDPNSSQTFVFDHLRLSAKDVKAYTPKKDTIEEIRSEISIQAEKYVQEHYQGGVWSVFSSRKNKQFSDPETETEEVKDVVEDEVDEKKDEEAKGEESKDEESKDAEAKDEEAKDEEAKDEEVKEEKSKPEETEEKSTEEPVQSTKKASNEVEDEEKKFQLCIVGNKYNPGNYWTGRWRSIYEIDLTSGTVKGHIQVNVHYYEQGNVQLTTRHTPIINLTSSSGSVTASQVMKSISQAETAYQRSVNVAYMELGDDTFKQLRRALPVTKQKIDWNNIKTKIVFNDK